MQNDGFTPATNFAIFAYRHTASARNYPIPPENTIAVRMPRSARRRHFLLGGLVALFDDDY